jgi:hypothetical protein
MSRRPKRQDVDALRARFVANREKVRSWISDWSCPEVEWPDFRQTPSPWSIPDSDERMWLQRHAPFLDEYWWLLEARPVTEGVSRVIAHWHFGERHRLKRLEVDIRSYADPAYLAEKLALAAHAAALEGWWEQDVHGLHAWLFEGIDSRPMSDMVRGQQRIGFILFEILRTPHSRTEIDARLRMTLAKTTLSGNPLNNAGESSSG